MAIREDVPAYTTHQRHCEGDDDGSPCTCLAIRPQEAFDHIVAALRSALDAKGQAEHGLALIEPHTTRGITDCSTPLHIRVQNIVEQLEQAEQRADAATKDRNGE